MLTEIFTRYKAHGLYVDGLTPHVCFCEHCRAKWRAMFGSEMPVDKLGKNPPRWAVWGEFGRDPQPVGDVENDPDARRWTEMMLRSLVEVTREFSRTVKQAKPDAVTLFHSHPKPGSDDDYDGTLTEVYTPRPWVHIAWRSGELAGYSAVYHVPVLFNIYPHRHFTAAEARYHALQGLAAGAYPNFWSALGMKPVADFMARCADYLDFDSAAPVKFLALPRDLRDSDTQRKTPRAAGVNYGSRDRFLAPYVGAYSALMRSGLPVVTLHRPRFEEDLAGFKVLVLANVALMSDAQAEAVRRFVRDGGGLVATHETSLYDEKGQRRKDFALADVLGVHYKTTLKSSGQDEPRVSVERAGAETMDWQPDADGADGPGVVARGDFARELPGHRALHGAVPLKTAVVFQRDFAAVPAAHAGPLDARFLPAQDDAAALRMWNDWTTGLTMDRNCWFQRGDALMLFLKTPFAPTQFAAFQRQSKLDAHSIVADPKFVNAAKLDFRLAPDSPARKLANGGPVGSRKRLKE